jgi:hypothetical protein
LKINISSSIPQSKNSGGTGKETEMRTSASQHDDRKVSMIGVGCCRPDRARELISGSTGDLDFAIDSHLE